MTRAFCSVCRGYFALKADGTVWTHNRFVARGKYSAQAAWMKCEGSGKLPAELDR